MDVIAEIFWGFAIRQTSFLPHLHPRRNGFTKMLVCDWRDFLKNINRRCGISSTETPTPTRFSREIYILYGMHDIYRFFETAR